MNTRKVKKLNQDDILEILIEHYWSDECKELLNARATLLGTPGKDLRAICVFGSESDHEISHLDLDKIDARSEYNGDHAFLEHNPSFLHDKGVTQH